MSDVAQILGLAAPSGAAAGGPGGGHAAELEQLKPAGASVALSRARGGSGAAGKPKKLTGMQREVLELLESTHRAGHSLYQGFSKPTLQQKWKERKLIPAVKWTRKPFRNPARAALAGEGADAGGLVLSHWAKAHVEPPAYVFARFNVACEATAYSEDEYARVLAPHHDPLAKWTKEETDVLMKLCTRFDLRWVVVADRYNTHPIAKGALRSVEDVKYRYYEVTRLLAEFRDKEKATAAESAVTASNGGVRQEEGAVEVKSEAEATVKAEPGVTTSTTAATAPATAAAPASSAAATPSSSPSSDRYYRFNIAYEKQRKRQLELAFTRTIEEENEIRKLNEELRSVEQQLKKAAVKVDPKKKKELADVPFEIKRSMPTGVFLRSATLALPPAQPKHHALSSKLVKKMQTMLDELGVPARPMPTKPVCDMFDHVRQDAVGLLTLRKHLAAKQAEAQLLKERYQSLTGKAFEPVTSKLQRSVRRGDSGAVAGAGANTSAGHSATPAAKGKSLKHSEKAPRTSSKRRSTGSGGLPAKRNKKLPH